MKPRYRLFLRRGSVYYAFDDQTKRFESLRTKDRREAVRLLHAKNESCQQPSINLHIARAYLMGSDPAAKTRTWCHVMEEMIRLKDGETQARWKRAARDPAFDSICDVPLIETRVEQFVTVLKTGTVSTNVYIRRLHNFALDVNWLPCPILPRRQWPAVHYGEHRAITLGEHQRIVSLETNPERRAFYELCWHLGGSQGDIASLHAEDVDWNDRTVAYRRKKTKAAALIHFGDAAAEILRGLPTFGPLFPALLPMRAAHRATEFRRVCRRAGITGVTLHSYRYAWAERAKTAGYPERYAQLALGHTSKAVHRAYAKKAQVSIPALEDFEKAPANGAALPAKCVPFPAGHAATRP